MSKAQTFVRRLASFAHLLWARPRVRVFLLIWAASFFVVFATLGVSFSYERHQREAEMAEVMPAAPRSPAEIRGIMNAMIRDHLAGHDNAPAVIPQSMWDDAACAGAVVSMTNFLIGGESRLHSTSAWTFGRDNPATTELIWDRGRLDFQVGEEHITEGHDRMWQFARFRRFQDIGTGESRTSARMYVLGYKYKRTLADPKILAALHEEGADLVGFNSHLVLLLGRMDGHWWGYHFFHDPDAREASPFRVDPIDDRYFTDRFDLVRIWEVRGTELGLQEVRMRIANQAGPYTRVRSYLGIANRLGERIGFFMDTAMMGLFGDSRQFPRVERIQETYASPRVAVNDNPPVGRPARPTANTATARRPSLERQGRTAPAHISRRPASPPRVGAHNDARRREHHAPHASHARR